MYSVMCKDAGKSFFEEFREMRADSVYARWQQQRSADFQTTCPRFPLLHMSSGAVYDDYSNDKYTHTRVNTQITTTIVLYTCRPHHVYK